MLKAGDFSVHFGGYIASSNSPEIVTHQRLRKLAIGGSQPCRTKYVKKSGETTHNSANREESPILWQEHHTSILLADFQSNMRLCCGWGTKKEARTGTATRTVIGASTTVTATGTLTDVGFSAAAAVPETVTATGASTGGATIPAKGTLTDLGSSAAAAVPETAILDVNEVGCTVIYEGEEPLRAE